MKTSGRSQNAIQGTETPMSRKRNNLGEKIMDYMGDDIVESKRDEMAHTLQVVLAEIMLEVMKGTRAAIKEDMDEMENRIVNRIQLAERELGQLVEGLNRNVDLLFSEQDRHIERQIKSTKPLIFD